MNRAFLGHLKSIIALPFVVIVVIPVIILYYNPSTLGFTPNNLIIILFAIGIVIIIGGFTLLTKTILLFSRIGNDNLAPWDK